MSKARRTRAVEAPASLDVHERIVGLLTHRHARWGGPLAAALVTLLVSAWTFDAKLSISGDNTEFVTLARSLAAGDGLTYTNRPEPRVATKYPFGLPLLLAPMAAAFGGWEGPGTGTPDWVAMKWLVVFTFAAGIGAFYLLARQVAGDDFAGVVEHSQCHDTLRVDVAAKLITGNYGQRVRQDRRLQTVLLDILALCVAHHPPALDELHPRHVGEEVTGAIHGRISSFFPRFSAGSYSLTEKNTLCPT